MFFLQNTTYLSLPAKKIVTKDDSEADYLN